MAIFLTKDSKVIVQGITGSEAGIHTARMLKAGTPLVGDCPSRQNAQVRTPPKRADLPLFTAVGVALHVGLPLALARHGPRHRPNAQVSRITKRVGQLLVASGATIVVSATLEHLRHDRSSRERAPWPGAVPEFIVLGGPYAFTRNPMYVGELLMWLGWTVMLNSGTVAIGSATMAGAMTLVVRREERRLNATGSPLDSLKLKDRSPQEE